MRSQNKKNLSAAAMFAVGLAALLDPSNARAADSPLYTFAMITHGQPGDNFWDIIRKGAEAAAVKDKVRLIYLANPTAPGEAQLIANVIQQHVDGIALTLAFPDPMKPYVKQAISAKIPVVGFNAGGDDWKGAGLMSYVGQDESVAGQAVGEKLNAEGAKSAICVDHQQGAVQLEARCDGIKKTFHGDVYVLYVPGYDMASAQSRIVAKLQQNTKIDYVVTLSAGFASAAITSVQMAGSKAKVGTFDLTPLAVKLIQSGKLSWTIDQQPFIEGYESIDLLWLYKTNGNVVGGGGPVATGPAFVDKTNIDLVAKFAGQGTR